MVLYTLMDHPRRYYRPVIATEMKASKNLLDLVLLYTQYTRYF
jgi:hypothetical protein